MTAQEFRRLEPYAVEKERSHVLMCVMAARNNLLGFMVEDLAEMLRGLAGANSEIAVLVMLTGPSLDSGIYEITNEGLRLVENLGLMNTNCDGVMARFFARGLKSYRPDTKFAAGFSGHGDGIFEAPSMTNAPLLSQLMFSGSLSTQKIWSALSYALYLSQREEKLDFLFIDTCINGTLETVASTCDYAETVAASQTSIPGSGWDYEGFLRRLSEKPPQTPSDWVAGAQLAWKKAYGNSLRKKPMVTAFYQNGRKLAEAFHHMAQGAFAGGAEAFELLTKARDRSAGVKGFDVVDLVDFCDQVYALDPESELSSLALNLQYVYQSEVLLGCERVGEGAERLHGMSFWFPPNGERFEVNRRNHVRASVSELETWTDFLEYYFSKESVQSG